MKTGKRTLAILLVLLLCTGLPAAFAASAAQAVADETTVSATGTNSVGRMLSAELDSKKAQDEADYAVTDLKMDGDTATVSMKNKTACYLVVAAYDEDSARMLSSNFTMLTANAETAALTLDDLSAENIVIKAFLLDTNYRALCKNYVFQEYTKEYKDFMEQDIFDFEEDRVLNLDEEIDKNFLVLDDSVVTVAQTGAVNQLLQADYDNNVYTFGNADAQITGLKAGDVFYWSDDAFSDVILVSVVSVEAGADGAATITGEDVPLEQAFELVKIDTESKGKGFELDESTVGEGVTPVGDSAPSAAPRKAIDVDVTKNLSKEYKLNKTFDNKDKTAKVNINGTAKFALDAELKIYVSKKFKEVSFAVKPSIRLDFNISAEGDTELQFGEFTAVPVPGLFISIEPTLHFNISASVTTGATIQMNLGFGYDSDNGFCNQSTKPEVDFDGVDAEATIYIGIDLKPRAYFLWDNLATVELTTECGFAVTGRMAWGHQEDIVKHACTNCIDGDVKFSVKLAVSLSFLAGTKFEETLQEDIWTKVFDVCDFYWSLTYRKFGLGECPYHLMKVDFLVLDEDTVEPLNGATIKTGVTDAIAIKYNNNSADVTTDAEGRATYYFPVGEFEPQVTMTDYRSRTADEIVVAYDEDSDVYTVNDTTTQVTIDTRLKASNIIASGECGIDARWEYDKDGTLTISGTGDMFNYGMYENQSTAPWHTFHSSIKKVVFEEGITRIGSNAFATGSSNYYYRYFTEVVFPSTLKEIGSDAFCNTFITEILLPDGMKCIEYSAFYRCKSLVYANIPGTVNEIGTGVFQQCSILTNVDIEDGVAEIPSGMFNNCINIKSIVIPRSVKVIGGMAFANCSGLKNVYYTGSESEWNSITFGNGQYGGQNEILKVNITYNYTRPSKSPRRAASAAETCTKTDAVAGLEYVLLAVKDSSLKTLLAPGNLLYIDQQTAASSTVTFQYVPREAADGSSAAIYGKSAPHEHSYTETVTKAATCTEPGERTFTCACGDTYTEEIPAAGHAWGDWVTVKEPSETEEGLAARVCGNDPAHRETKTLDRLEPQTEKPDNPENPQPDPNACKYCGKVHAGPFAWLVKFFHNIFAAFKR